MKKQLQIRTKLVEITILALLSLSLAGCRQEKQDAAAVPAAPVVEQTKANESPAVNVQPAAVETAAAMPKDHPVH